VTQNRPLNTQSNEPITTEIYADDAFFDSNKNQGIFSGHVKVADPRFTLQSEKLTVYITKGQNQGLVNALTKMKAVGHIAIPGTLGFDLAYIRMIPTATGRQIRFATNRKIAFGEAYADSQSMAYNLSAGEININDQDKSMSDGVLYPASQLIINDQGQLQIELRQNPWRLSDIIDWKGTAEN
jgi:lipopolysaccharide export system protein LptA